MSGEETARKFFSSYQNHDFRSMQSCLDENVHFSDFAFDIKGHRVFAMWHLFCSETDRRPPVDVPLFEIIDASGDFLRARYRVSYLFGESKRMVDYEIEAHLRLNNDRIIEHTDISDIKKWASMAFPGPTYLIAHTAPFRKRVRKQAMDRLNDFMGDEAYRAYLHSNLLQQKLPVSS